MGQGEGEAETYGEKREFNNLAMFHYVIEELSSRNIFHNHEYVSGS